MNLQFTVCDNPSKCVLNTQQFAHVEILHTPEERFAVLHIWALCQCIV